MAPRTTKAKKNTEVQPIESEAPKKGRGKTKVEKVVESNVENELNEENVEISEKKTKRGKRPAVKENGTVEASAPAPKKGRKKNVENETKDNDNSKESTQADENGEEEVLTNGDSDAVVSKGQKVQSKKVTKSKEPAKAKKTTKQVEDKEAEQKPKGRGRKPKAEDIEDLEQNKDDEEEKPEPAAKGRRKGKLAQAKSEETEEENTEDKIEPEPKKKETKGRKNVTKKVPSKQESEDEVESKEETSAESNNDTKNALKETEQVKEDSDAKEEESAPEVKQTKGKRGQKKTVEKKTGAEEEQDNGEPATKRRRKVDATEEKKPVMVKSVTDYESIDFTNTSKNAQGKEWNFKICTWNVDGIRAWLSKGGLDYIKYEKPDILCLQETKCSQEKLPTEITNLPGYHAYWLCSDKDGYAGVGVYTTKLAMNVQYGLQNEELDSEGRIITAEYELFYLICTYVPNAGRKLVTLPKRLKWNEEFRRHVQMLDKKKPVIICGDMNVAHNEIDLKNPKTNKKNAGFTEEERAGMTDLLGDGFVDVYRHYYPDKAGAYTFWTYMSNSRAKNVGWRLDYFIVSQRLLPSICDSVIRDKVYGSDHCPLSLFLHLTSADKPKE
ncbi:DNA-(apurinic or apyrimidinic site) endonuclease-like [Aricia agestis]|uniref:DNA-(apurinic or apyrimidinic site) endonuclease-like n=1 Tax=Aricia agestis TaxID=91739 RepID=UPI001C205FD2|nr:DNA-(apurinic or apyrimidinic site) endonuclease-like [Aricia agestis]